MLLTEDKINELKNLISSFDLKEVNKWRRFRVVASTEDSDRAWEIIKANWWDYKNFMKNPVIIANHVYKIENIVGKATSIYVMDNQLIIEWVFSESNPLWKLLADLYDEWMVKTVSVWFIPKSRDESNKRIITSAELLELSFVAVPCNPNALSLDQKQLLEENGTNLPTTIVKHIEGEIYELRPGNNRIFFFCVDDDTFILLHHFRKQTRKTPKREILRAHAEISDYYMRKELDNELEWI